MTRFPAPGPWPHAEPGALGFDPQALAAAAAFAMEAETSWPRDLSAGLNADPASNEPAPWNKVLGPTRDRGAPNGLVIRHGRCAARWGDTARVDMTFSVAKSYLAILAGVALREGLIRDLDQRVAETALDDGFDSVQNRDITWRHFLHQTSEWEGTLWDKPDLVDRNRQVGVGADNSRKGTHRDLQRPGSFFEYNDVRVNRFSLALLHVFREPLPEVLRREVMSPIGCSDTWEWLAYANAWVEIDGRRMPSVPGGAHWGGGIVISSDDHARFALMVLEDGSWDGRRILPEGFVAALRSPSPVFANYGFLWWLNTGGRQYANAPESSFFALGAGYNVVWLDRDLDLVAVTRWIDQPRINDWIGKVMAALR
jgi:CubicO group peptidase (beta-lactamase class C family)